MLHGQATAGRDTAIVSLRQGHMNTCLYDGASALGNHGIFTREKIVACCLCTATDRQLGEGVGRVALYQQADRHDG